MLAFFFCMGIQARAVFRCIACAAAFTSPYPPFARGGKSAASSLFPPCEGGLGGGGDDFVPVRRTRTRRYERIAGPRWHPSHSREIVIQSVMEIRISEPRAGGRFRPLFWLAVSRPHADRGRCRRGRVAAWEAVPPGSCARPSAPS